MNEQEINREFLAWFAGFWEGEGSISRNRLSIYQKEKTPLEIIQSKFGGNLNLRERTTSFPPRNPIWVWDICHRKKLIEVLEAVSPFLKFRQDKVSKELEELKEREEKNPSRKPPHRSKLRAWETREEEFVRSNHGKMLDWEMGSVLGRTAESVRARRYKLGLRRDFERAIKLREKKNPAYVSSRIANLQAARRQKHPNWGWKK